MSDDRQDTDAGPLDELDHQGPNGVRPSGLHIRSVPLEEIEEPIDLVAVQADDELVSALAAGMSVSSPGVGGYDADDRVAAILAAWKADVEAEPIPELVDVDTAVSTILAATRPPSRRARHLTPIAAAAAFIVFSIGGLSVGSYNAQPDSMLWGVSKVFFSERAKSVEAAIQVEDHIAKAKRALVAGQPELAAQELAQAESALTRVRPEEGREELAETQDFLSAKAAETPSGQPTDPGTPLTSEPQRPVPSKAAIDEGETDTTTAPDTVSDTLQPSAPTDPRKQNDPRTHTADPRIAQNPEQGSNPPQPTTKQPPPTRIDEGKPDPTTGGGGPSPTATPDGKPNPTTTKQPPPPSSTGDGSEGSPTASGSDSEPTTN